jgi:glutaconate CoA-transferase, subunit B
LNADVVEAATTREMIVIVLARELRDGDIGAWGAGGLIPIAAIRLAKLTHAPHLVIGGERVYGSPVAPSLQETLDDTESVHGAISVEGYWELFGHWHHGLDFFCFSGLQVDRYGNLNLHEIAREGKAPIRGAGVANISLAGSCSRTYIYMTEHSRRRFVERVGFCSLPGHLDGGDTRRAAGLTGGGPALCISPLGVFDFPTPGCRMRIRSLHDGVTLEQAQESTGFKLDVDDSWETTPQPTTEELQVLRRAIDPSGRLRS